MNDLSPAPPPPDRARPPDPPADAWLEGVRRGDAAAERALVESLYPLVARVVRAHLPRREEPEDLMQEVFFRMFSRLHQFRGDAPLEHWVGRIARRTCCDRLRRQRARPELLRSELTDAEASLLEQCAEPDQARSADASAALTLVERLLATMSPVDAWLIRCVELEGQSIAEIRESTGWNAGLTRVRIFRARRRLRSAYLKLESSSHESPPA